MSKDNNNLRLLGSPVNLSYRSKKKDDRKNIRNRPRSAHQSSCFTPESHERYKRPFSADTKERVPSTRSFLKNFSADLLQSYNNNTSHVKIFPPTTELLGTKPCENFTACGDKEMCSNASDYGSEDTFISLGTKIKTKAQTTPKNKNIKATKYRNIVKRGRKVEELANNDKTDHNYGLEITITERAQSPCKNKNVLYHRSASPTVKNKTYESYFVAFNGHDKCKDNNASNELFDSESKQYDIEKSIDTYSSRLKLTKQQLSLVEEESMQELESIPPIYNTKTNLSPETPLNDKHLNNKLKQFPDLNSFSHIENIDEPCDEIKHTQEFPNESRTYGSFYDDFNRNHDLFKTIFSSTIIHTDSSSKDSGYPDSVVKEEITYSQNFSLPSTTLVKKSNSDNKLQEQPKSLDSSSTISNDKDYRKTYPLDKKWTKPLNHSRLLYKDFFLKKEGHLALPPQNSPDRSDPSENTERTDVSTEVNDENKNFDYPKYLLNSSTKAYTSKVIEEYKREIEAINNLHELTLKDIKTDTISPTPLNIDVIFENDNQFKDKYDSIESSQKSSDIGDIKVEDKNSLHNHKSNISEVTTKELIQNYLKVKHDYPKGVKDNVIKTLKKFDKKINNNNKLDDKCSSSNTECRSSKNTVMKSVHDNIKRQSPKNIFTSKIPLSARIESVQNDKDVDSWMSLTIPSPRVIDVVPTDHAENVKEVIKVETPAVTIIEPENCVNPSHENIGQVEDLHKPKELDSKSTVLDIYSMLKEIESYGDNPVTADSDVTVTENVVLKEDERTSMPKDNFIEIFEFLENVEQSANDALSVVTNSTPQATPKLEVLLKLPHTELAQRLVTASLQLEERSCCIALLQESLANHKQQMITKVNNLEKQSQRHAIKVKQECEETIKRHQNFIDQLINDKKTLNHRIEQLVDERRSMEDRWKRSVQTLEERYKLELRNQHDRMVAAQQVARQRWVKQKAEKIKELTVKGLEGELREMAERQQKEISDLKMAHAEQMGRAQAKHTSELEELRRRMEEEKEDARIKERQIASSRLEKQILEIELTYQEQRTRLVSELRAESERAAEQLSERERQQRSSVEKWREDQEKLLEQKRAELAEEMAAEKAKVEELLKRNRNEIEEEFERHRREFEAEQQAAFKRKVSEITAQYKLERDREIEKAIENMEAEAQAGRKELQEALRRNKEQFEIELKELAETEQATLRRYQDAQARVRQTEDRCAELEVTIGQLQTRNKVFTEKNIQLEAQIEDAKTSCDEAWRCKVDALNKEMDELKKTHDEQMHQLYAKVKVAVARKDSAIQALTREAAKHQEKITLLEQKLQQQRKDFLKQK